jgi:hypothetical protein
MTDALFPNFLADPIDYDQAADCWKRVWAQVTARAAGGELWSMPWIDNSFANGTPCRDGNPIFSAVCHSRRRAIRVIQLDPSLDQNQFSFWSDTFAKGEPEELEELAIACVLNGRAIQQAARLFGEWVNGGAVCASKA